MKYTKYFFILLLGSLCFWVSQIKIRLPLLTTIIYKNSKFTIFEMKNPLLAGIFIAASAGIFEEGFRFLFRKFLLKNSRNIVEAAIFGLGHSLMEILYLFYVTSFHTALFSISIWGILERILATFLHIELSILLWLGFLKNKKYRILILAMLLHTFVDSIIPVAGYFRRSIWEVEFLFFAIVLWIGILLIKYHKREENL
ncbi:YhfC family glutamic-type intramembrane protease [Fusobacterium necrophorum]|uniref:YhfC family glutamic-type intramembrane protease n=1 Tax=Fusobacterium necrophorum TaxID=859 RepID=UPI00254DD509|nr:YhfC family glutamic-type intramembrane protease [Fusobacterium necrophorum]MDK4470443.1 YhfC family intramembrane metalloprotease [Fusobacterium necrophorum]